MHAMTVDVEDWFQVQAYAGCIARDQWDGMERRVEPNTDRILARFAEAGVSGTFFTLGWVAERHPALVRRIVAAGHELASHGYWHRLAHEETPQAFAQDVGRAKGLLEDVGGVAVRGYRAPTFSIGARNLWAYDVLEAAGYAYSSSVYPVRHDLYGSPDAPRFPYRVGGLWEIPMTTVRVGGRNYPFSGGGYFRLMPYAMYRAGLRRYERRDAASGMFYFHPWEVDPDQPTVPRARFSARFRHRVNIRRMEGRVRALLRDFSWDRLDRVFEGALSDGVRGEALPPAGSGAEPRLS